MTNQLTGFDPIRETFKDVTAGKLIISSWTVFWRIMKLQGWSGAFRVLPIIWTIIVSVRGFARYHQKEFLKIAEAVELGHDYEEEALTLEENEEYRRLGRWLRQRLFELGPTFIKIGQTLSTRADLVPLPAMLELATLQEDVEPFSSVLARQIITRELGKPPQELYSQFSEEPIAAASLSQVYKAVLHDGRDVVVKVQRPDLLHVISNDVETLAAVADEVMKYPSLCRHTDWPGVVAEFARTIFEEIDYIREGRNADTFRHNFRNDASIFIPRIIWRLTGRRVLTIEYVPGVRVTDAEGLRDIGLSANEVTELGAYFYLRQLLEDGFFHADPHPGNMRIMPDGRVGIFDFGMVGKITPELKQAMVNSFLHVVKGEYRLLVDDFVDMGFLKASADREALYQELRPILEARFEEGVTRVKFRKVLFDFSDVVYRYPFRLPADFTYVMRALLTLEGIALEVNPGFNFVEAAMPFAQRLLWRDGGATIGRALIKGVFTDGRFNAQAAFNLLKSAYRISAELRN